MSAVGPYLAELVARARDVLGRDLLGAYAGGSWALGAYEHGRSDLDVALVAAGPPGPRAERLVEALRHEALPCPARGLELVVYDREGRVLLNLNSGAGMAFRLDLQPDAAEWHWFVLDRAILREHGHVLHGPPPAEALAPVSPEEVRAALAASLRWHLGGEAQTDDAVLNACRALRWARTGEWVSKPAAGRWALTALDAPGLVRDALAAREGAPQPDGAAALAFVERALVELG